VSKVWESSEASPIALSVVNQVAQKLNLTTDELSYNVGHIVFDDDNLTDKDIDFCLSDEALVDGMDVDVAERVRTCLRALLEIPYQDRIKHNNAT